MPTLDWIGKDKVINHHRDVPFRVLEEKYTYNAEHSDNMIIHGDNLSALKSLLPKYEGRIKCIYIDPPYNTGNEGWVYNDNVNDPRIKEWLGNVVGAESVDFSRHDKWLCMMYPRLKLLHKLLAEDGAIFISIDDNEQSYLRLICDEIFGRNNFVANTSWQRTYSMRNDVKGIASEVEYILIYGKNPEWQPKKLDRTEKMDSKYKNPDNDPEGAWRNIVASAPNANTHQGMVYAIQNPTTGELAYPPQGRCWALGQDSMLDAMNKWAEYELCEINDDEARAKVCGVSPDEVRKNVPAIMLKESLESAREKANIVMKGVLPEFYFSKNGTGTLSRKAHIKNVAGRPVTNYWSFEETGHTDEASRLLKGIFDGKAVFDTPKPPRLIERILQIATENDSIMLDSFGGSGTTAHAVLNMNKQDGGNRKFILIEMMDYAESITAERVKRVIDGYGDGKNKVEGTGGSFTFYYLGEMLLLPDGNLNENVGLDKIREYVYFMETKEPIMPESDNDEPYFMGVCRDTAYYFYYEKDAATTLSIDFLPQIKKKAEGYVIYADMCTIDKSDLKKWNIIFKKIPRDITRL